MHSEKSQLPTWVTMAEEMRDFHLPTFVNDTEFTPEKLFDEGKPEAFQGDGKWSTYVKYTVVIGSVVAAAFVISMAAFPFLISFLPETEPPKSESLKSDQQKGNFSITKGSATPGIPASPSSPATTKNISESSSMTNTILPTTKQIIATTTAITEKQEQTTQKSSTTASTTRNRTTKPAKESPAVQTKTTITTTTIGTTSSTQSTTKRPETTTKRKSTVTTTTSPKTKRVTSPVSPTLKTTHRVSTMLADLIKNLTKMVLTTPKPNTIESKANECKEKPVGERDCLAIQKKGCNRSGRYLISPTKDVKPIPVICDMNSFGGGWTIFQRRYNGLLDFSRNWTEYENGFGSADKEYWLGNRYLHLLTKDQSELLVIMTNFKNDRKYARYSYFRIGSEKEEYKLEVKGYKGTAGDSITTKGGSRTNGMKFSAPGRDNDLSNGDCAMYYKAGWWFNNCHHCQLNGKYCGEGKVGYNCNMWYTFNKTEGLKTSMMMTRRT